MALLLEMGKIYPRREPEGQSTGFSTGMGIALFMFGASEPIYHLEQSLRYSALAQHLQCSQVAVLCVLKHSQGQSSMSYNLASKEALMLAYFHFGIHAWVPFAIVGIALAIARYRCVSPFLPLSLSATDSRKGVATLVGFAAIQVAAGINYQSGKIPYIGIDGKEIQNYKTLVRAGTADTSTDSNLTDPRS
eukprot:765634-Hanusia_phi.AAC.3